MNRYNSISKILIDLIFELNEIKNKSNKILCKFRIRDKMHRAKNNIKSVLRKEKYTAYDIFEFLQFLKMTQGPVLGIKIGLPSNISYSCYKNDNETELSSGVFSVTINYSKTKKMCITYKPVVSIDYSKINMEWTIGDDHTYIEDFKTITSDMQTYSSSVDILIDKPINPSDPVSQTKILEFSSAGILYEAFIVCIETIFKNIELRYINEKKK